MISIIGSSVILGVIVVAYFASGAGRDRTARAVWLVFWLGFVTGTNAIGAREDLFGSVDAYVAYVREHWIDSTITGPIHATMIAIMVFVTYRIAQGRRRRGGTDGDG